MHGVRGYTSGMIPCMVLTNVLDAKHAKVLKPLPIEDDGGAASFLSSFLPRTLKLTADLYVVARFYGVRDWIDCQLGEKAAKALQSLDVDRIGKRARACLIHQGSNLFDSLTRFEAPKFNAVLTKKDAYLFSQVGLPFIMFGTVERLRQLINSLVDSTDLEGVRMQKALMERGINAIVFPAATDEWLLPRLKSMEEEAAKLFFGEGGKR